MKITFISDTHNKHNEITKYLPGGDLIIHAGDFSSMGYDHELTNFLKWFSKLDYTNKIFIAGNHDFCFQDSPYKSKDVVNQYEDEGVTYLQDDFIYIGDHPNLVKIYGTPWQPEFMGWAFNLPRNGWELEQKWNDIPNDTDILITHGPPFGHLDKVIGRTDNLGCELLEKRINDFKPKIHTFGHIHTGYGYKTNDNTHFVNASVLNEHYINANIPLTVEFDNKLNQFTFI